MVKVVDKKDGFDETFPLKVSSIAELKKALRDDLKKICLDLLAQGLDGRKPLRYVKKLADSYSKKIDSLSAGLRERIKEFQRYPELTPLQDRISELRRVVGGEK